MNSTKKLVYAAACTALALLCLIVSRYFPFLSVTPLMAASLCFFIAFCSGFYYGFLCIAATLIAGFFITGGIGATFLLTALIFAPYSIMAFLIKKLTYKPLKSALIRVVAVTVLLNALLAALVFGLGGFVADAVIFGFSISSIINYLGGAAIGYAVLAVLFTIFMAGFDYLFVTASQILRKRLKI